MKVREVMSKTPEFVPPTMNLWEASNEMSKYEFGFLPVGENDKLIGTITDRDIIIRGIAKHKNPDKTLVKDLMTSDVHYCFEEDDIQKAAELMKKEQVRRLIVLNKDKRMTGILSTGDIARNTEDTQLLGTILKMISTGNADH
jgi:CBS domain-containing protein